MEEEKNINKFVIICENCQAAGRIHHTLLYVDWNKRYYMITCYKCDTTEAFNENGKKIEFKGPQLETKEPDLPKTSQDDDDKKIIN